jgi:glycine cleavage system H lipoate-binding protein/ABC-type phosphate transport system substrate-binding protein
MKTMIKYFAVLLLAAAVQAFGTGSNLFAAASPQDETTIQAESSLTVIAEKWADAYREAYPGRVINVDQYISGENAGVVSGNELLFVSDRALNGELASLWKMVVARDVVVPVISRNNPWLQKIEESGVSQKNLAEALAIGERDGWRRLAGEGSHGNVSLYMVDDVSVADAVAGFTGSRVYQSSAVMAVSGAEVIEMVRMNALSIGFCKLADITDEGGDNLAEGIALLPVDMNGNGTLDYFEDIYSDLETLQRGIWIGKYPRTLVANIYAISAEAPVDEAHRAFLKWVVTGGQDYLAAGSLAELNPNERYSRIAGLTTATTEAVSVSQAGTPGRTIIITVALLAGLLFISFSLSRFIGKGEEEVSLQPFPSKGMMDEESVSVPGGLFYDRTHTWAFMERSGEVRVGIDDFLQKVTGRVTKVIMKKPGERISRGEKAITIVQDGKQLVVYSPVSGVVRKSNEELMEYAGMINSSPYSEGWVYLVEPENWSAEVARMRDAGKYRTWLKEEFARMRDFLSSLMNSGQLNEGIVLQDGGEIAENVLNTLDPRSWEDFQTRFIDTSR